MKNIHVLPTVHPSRLSFDFDIQQYYLQKESSFFEHQDIIENRNIYITKNEEIKEENLNKEIYVIDIQNGNIGKLTCKNRFFKGSSKLIEIEWKNKQNIWNYNHIREIILTDNKDLIADGIQPIDNEFLEWFVKNPSCEFIKTYWNPLNNEYDFLIPKEEYKKERERGIIITHVGKQETLEEVVEKNKKKRVI